MSAQFQSKTFTEQETGILRSINRIVSMFREADGEMPVQQMAVLCWVSMNEGSTQRDLCAALDMATSTASRNIAALSEVHRLGKPGLGLVAWTDDPFDRRVKRLCLSVKGKHFVASLIRSY